MVDLSGIGGTGCRIDIPKPNQGSLSLTFQGTNPANNQPVGQPNVPVSLSPKGTATFLLSFRAFGPVQIPGLQLVYSCSGETPVAGQVGISAVDVTFSSSPIANIFALNATAAGNDIVTIPFSSGGAGAFAVATDNTGASSQITVSTDTGSTFLPLAVTACQTNPATGACLASPSSSFSISVASGATPTFSVFATAFQPIALSPGTSRIFLRFKNASGQEVGATSVAVQTS